MFFDVVNHPRRYLSERAAAGQLGNRLQPRELDLTLATASGSAAILFRAKQRTEKKRETRKKKKNGDDKRKK